MSLPPETPSSLRSSFNLLQSNHRKSAAALAWNVQHLAAEYGLEYLGFLTLTFTDHVLDPKEAQKRWHSLKTHILREFPGWVRVFERMKHGRIHYHVLLVLPDDIRTGCNFEEFTQGNYKSASPALRRWWAFWRDTAKRYRFGRTELLPVKSTAEGIAKYVGKYISKHIDAREERDKGVRLVEYSKGVRAASTRFAWHTAGSNAWRLKLRLFATAFKIPELEDMTAVFGCKWAFHLEPVITGLRLPVYQDQQLAAVDYQGDFGLEAWPSVGVGDYVISGDYWFVARSINYFQLVYLRKCLLREAGGKMPCYSGVLRKAVRAWQVGWPDYIDGLDKGEVQRVQRVISRLHREACLTNEVRNKVTSND